MKRAIRLASLAIATLSLLLVGCTGVKDIRPKTSQGAPSEENVTRGRELLAAMSKAHGVDTYNAHTWVKITVHDDWTMAPFPVNLVKPLPSDPQDYVVEVNPGSKDANLTFTNGEANGMVWGVEDGRTFRTEVGGTPRFEEDDFIRRTVASLAFSLTAPLTLQEADTVFALGSEELNGRTYEKVFVTWGSTEPDPDFDQFIAWIDTETFHLCYLEHTLRAFVGNLKGTTAFEDHRDVDGIVYPHKVTDVRGVGGPPKIHIMQVESIETGR